MLRRLGFQWFYQKVPLRLTSLSIKTIFAVKWHELFILFWDVNRFIQGDTDNMFSAWFFCQPLSKWRILNSFPLQTHRGLSIPETHTCMLQIQATRLEQAHTKNLKACNDTVQTTLVKWPCHYFLYSTL